MTGPLTEGDLLGFFDSLSNWGRWGPLSHLGTLNYINDQVRARAALLIRRGRTVSLSWHVDPNDPPDDVPAPVRFIRKSGQGLADPGRIVAPNRSLTDRSSSTSEFIGATNHGIRLTHLDSLSHYFWDGEMFGGHPAEHVSSEFGATRQDISDASGGFFTRGVLVDVPKHRGIAWLEPGDAVTADEVEHVLENEQVQLEPGDAILLRTGFGRWRMEQGDHTSIVQEGRAGWHASCLPLFYDSRVSLVGADTAQDPIPSGFVSVRSPIHMIGITRLGLWLLDNCNLEPLASICDEASTSTFAIAVAPIPFVGSTSSLVNPLGLL